MSNIESIEGVGPSLAAKLKDAGIDSVADLLSKARTKAHRESFAAATGIAESAILKFVNHADLMRIDGVGPQFAELLEAAGVDSVSELAQRNAANLASKLKEINDAKNLVNSVPSESSVEKWIQEANELPKLVTH